MKSDAKKISSPQSVTRDEALPQSNSTPAPVIFFILLALFIFVGALYIDQFGGDFSAKIYAPYANEAEVAAQRPLIKEDPQAALGKKVYNTACVPCHQATGTGTAGQFPPLAGSEWVNAESPERIIRIVLNGVSGPISVKGTEFNNAMPPWRDVYKDDEIAAVLTYIRGHKDWSNHAAAVKPEQVKAARGATADRSTPWTSPELQQVQ